MNLMNHMKQKRAHDGFSKKIRDIFCVKGYGTRKKGS